MRVLYICTGNCFRSPVAEALTRILRPELEVESAGTEPTDFIAENAKELLREEGGEQYLKPEPDKVSQKAVERADKIVVMEEKHQDFLEDKFDVSGKEIINWSVEDPIKPGVDDREQFEKLKKKVRTV